MTEIKKMYPYQLANVGKKYEDKWSKSFYMNVDDLIAWLKDIGLVYDGGGVWVYECPACQSRMETNYETE